MNFEKVFHIILVVIVIASCQSSKKMWRAEVYETAANGNKLQKIEPLTAADDVVKITIKPEERYQQIIGFGGAFTESRRTCSTGLAKKTGTGFYRHISVKQAQIIP